MVRKPRYHDTIVSPALGLVWIPHFSSSKTACPSPTCLRTSVELAIDSDNSKAELAIELYTQWPIQPSTLYILVTEPSASHRVVRRAGNRVCTTRLPAIEFVQWPSCLYNGHRVCTMAIDCLQWPSSLLQGRAGHRFCSMAESAMYNAMVEAADGLYKLDGLNTLGQIPNSHALTCHQSDGLSPNDTARASQAAAGIANAAGGS
ncbi:hypothetical protein PCASD_08898 [Puccinia coronata f. sp. avenae]|uniref:Uncharacterized protein n=1 Tax=Puccinia coronata f. sp. avenae TaxID=200324 RepID=A0A2N5UUC7_9BASI|nr:hypothetical protein PCASD_08898 [Puccinia coronata f. sp. avenae]